MTFHMIIIAYNILLMANAIKLPVLSDCDMQARRHCHKMTSVNSPNLPLFAQVHYSLFHKEIASLLEVANIIIPCEKEELGSMQRF